MSAQLQPRSDRPGSWGTASLAAAHEGLVQARIDTSVQNTARETSEQPSLGNDTAPPVRNTFIDTPLDRMHSIDGYLQERRVQSCPVENPPTLDEEEPDAVPSAAHQLRRSLTTSAAAMATVASETAAMVTGWWQSSTGSEDAAYLEETFEVVQSPQAPAHPSSIAAAPPVLLLSQMIEAPPSMDLSQIPLGSPDMPTMGSAGHWIGDCKPCAFYHKRGCTNGVECNFCHLCDSSEKKRRQKEKVQQLKEMRRQGVSV